MVGLRGAAWSSKVHDNPKFECGRLISANGHGLLQHVSSYLIIANDNFPASKRQLNLIPKIPKLTLDIYLRTAPFASSLDNHEAEQLRD